MAEFIKDAPKSQDPEARQILAVNSKLRTVKPRETSNGSVARGGKRVAGKMNVRGGKQ